MTVKSYWLAVPIGLAILVALEVANLFRKATRVG